MMTPMEIEEAKKLRAEGKGWKPIFAAFPQYAPYDIMKLIDYEYYTRRRGQQAGCDKRRAEIRSKSQSKPNPFPVLSGRTRVEFLPNNEVLVHTAGERVARTRRWDSNEDTTTAKLLGDPARGRSALDQMGGRFKSSYPSYNGY